MASRFLGLVGSLPLEEQQLWLHNQQAHDPDSWTAPVIGVHESPLDGLYKAFVRNQELPQPGDSRPLMPPSQRALSKQMMKYWGPWETNMQKSTNQRMLQQLAFRMQQII
jgi:hypothetical protein